MLIILQVGHPQFFLQGKLAAQVVQALSKKSGTTHVPYRSSKLTHFLKDSMGTGCQLCLIACIWSDVRPRFSTSFLHAPCEPAVKITHRTQI